MKPRSSTSALRFVSTNLKLSCDKLKIKMKTASKPEYPKTPALNKMQSVKDKSQLIGEFLDWLPHNNRAIGLFDKHGAMCHDHQSIESLLAEYFGIDLKACEKERRAVLEYVRKTQ